MMQNQVDPSNELESSDFEGCDISFTSKLEDLKAVKFFIVAVPTPIDSSKEPNIKPLISASETVGKYLKRGILWYMNLQYIQVVRKKIVFLY